MLILFVWKKLEPNYNISYYYVSRNQHPPGPSSSHLFTYRCCYYPHLQHLLALLHEKSRKELYHDHHPNLNTLRSWISDHAHLNNYLGQIWLESQCTWPNRLCGKWLQFVLDSSSCVIHSLPLQIYHRIKEFPLQEIHYRCFVHLLNLKPCFSNIVIFIPPLSLIFWPGSLWESGKTKSMSSSKEDIQSDTESRVKKCTWFTFLQEMSLEKLSLCWQHLFIIGKFIKLWRIPQIFSVLSNIAHQDCFGYHSFLFCAHYQEFWVTLLKLWTIKWTQRLLSYLYPCWDMSGRFWIFGFTGVFKKVMKWVEIASYLKPLYLRLSREMMTKV